MKKSVMYILWFYSFKLCIPKFLYFTIAIVAFLNVSTAVAFIPKVEIRGAYQSTTGLFSGTVRYEIIDFSADELLFHLPPNWYNDTDRRNEYELQVDGDEHKTVQLKDLRFPERPNPENIYLPQGLSLISVTADNTPTPFRILDNPRLSPLKSIHKTLLAVSTRPSSTKKPVIIEIKFQTRLNQLPSGFQNLLWDYIPRPVGFYNGNWDLKDNLPPRIEQRAHVEILDEVGNTIRTIKNEYESTIPYLLIDQWNIIEDQLKLSYDSYFQDTEADLRNRIRHVISFLKKNGLLHHDYRDLRFILWDGPLQVSGLTIFLPRQLFRYPNEFYKQFEITILNGIVAALLNKKFLLDSHQNPWILPSVQSEVLRLFFQKRFNGNTHIFPWVNWINPEYFSDHSNRRWLENKLEKEVVAADIPLDIAYYSHIYHPGHEKGFHLLWMMHDGRQDYRKVLIRKISHFLRNMSKKRELLSRDLFIDYFATIPGSTKIAEKWLSTNGSVDYALEKVDVLEQKNRYQVQMEIRNSGTLSPALEVKFVFSDGVSNKKLISTGAGLYLFDFAHRPTEIILDPSFNILDDDLLNNTLQFPVRTRPLWDFQAADNWLLTISPLVGDGNTFDQNILGLNLSFGYLNYLQNQLSIWKGDSEDLLWTCELFKNGFPFQGSTVYLNAGYLGAISSVSIGINQSEFKYDPELRLDFSIWKERLDILEDSIYAENERDWTGLKLSFGFPIIRRATSRWQLNLEGLAGNSLFEPETEYYQLRIEQNLQIDIGDSDIHLGYDHGYSVGTVPLQKRYSIGGTSGLPGFPRSTDLLFSESRILEVGTSLPGIFTHTNINLLEIMWLNRIVPTLNFHFGQGIHDNGTIEDFTDVEFRLNIFGEFIDRFSGNGKFAIAQPFNHEKYKDYRLIVFSNWIF